MAQSINLIPQEERVQQRKVKIVKMSSVLSVFVLLLVGGIAAYYWYTSNIVKGQIEKTDEKIANFRKDIDSLEEIEITARTLDAKYNILDQLFKERRNYSKLMLELRNRIPESVTVDTFNLSGEELTSVNLSGKGSDYISIARFINTMSDSQFDGGEEGLEELFTKITLNSVSLDSQDASVKYFIVAEFNEELLN